MVSMNRVGSASNMANSVRSRKERRLTYVLCDSYDSKHCSGINCLRVSSLEGEQKDILFSGSRDGTLKRWEVVDENSTCTATFESHTDWVNDAVLSGETLVSCSSDATIKTWRAFSDDSHCLKTFRQHSDYVISLASAKHTNIIASAGLGGEVFVWDLDAASVPVVKAAMDENVSEQNSILGPSAPITSSDRPVMSFNTAAQNPSSTQGYTPLTIKGHKESVYALAMNDAGTMLVSGGTEKAVRVWDPRSGTKVMKLKGHTDNIRALSLDPSGRLCLSGSSDSMIRLWDLGQQRCVHSYAVHTDSVWAFATSQSFSYVYSGGRDLSVYLTDLVSRESLLICSEENPILSLALQSDDWLWAATSDSSIHKWPTKERSSAKNLLRASSFVAGTLPYARAKACLENSPPVPLNAKPACIIPGTPGILQHVVLNDKRHVLTKDAAGVVKLWEITKGAVIADFGKVPFHEKEKELFEMMSIPTWFTIDTRLGSISVHLEMPQCFSAEMYAVDLQVPGATEEQKLNLGQETLRGLFSQWLIRGQQKGSVVPSVNGDVQSGREVGNGNHSNSRAPMNLESRAGIDNLHPTIYPAFEFSTSCMPSIITEGTQGGPWRRKLTELDGNEDEKSLPSWCLDCLLQGKLPQKENTKCSFYLHPYEAVATPSVQSVTPGKLSAPRILRINKVINYVLEKLVLDRPSEEAVSNSNSQQQTMNGRPSTRVWQLGTRPEVEILCNNQVLRPEMSLATVRQYIWKKPDDLYLYYRITSNR